jgi:1-acyl-sn-glycerol-3-phosphate acyltransferase
VSEALVKLEDHGFDAFGWDPAFEERARPLLSWLMERAFRLQIEGAQNIDADRPAILVGNHAGALPWDAVVLRAALQEHAGLTIRPLVEDAVMSSPFLGVVMNRLGCVRASQENAMRLLDRGESIAVFPEGALGLGKRYRRRYRLQRFGRGGFVRLALRARTPLVPVAILGAEDTAPLLARLTLPAKRNGGLPHVPITPTFPALGLAGLLPLPARWSIRVGEPIDVAAELGEDASAVEIGEMASHIRDRIQKDVRELAEERPTIYR